MDYRLCPNHLLDTTKDTICYTFANIPKGYVAFPTVELLG